HHHDEREDLAVGVVPVAAEPDEGDVGPVQEELHGQEEEQGVAAHDHADQPEHEEHAGEAEAPGERAAGHRPPSIWTARSPRSTAPTEATRRRSEVASKGTR